MPKKIKDATKDIHKKNKLAKPAQINKDKNNTKKRYFKLFFNDKSEGRFCGIKPRQAANKALTSIINKLKKQGKDTEKEFRFSIIECTRGSKHKEYEYTGKREKLKNPINVQIGGENNKKEITYYYNNKVKKFKENKKNAV